MANKQIDMQNKTDIQAPHLGCEQTADKPATGISRNTVAKDIDFFKRLCLTTDVVEKMTLEELHGLFKADRARN